MLLEEIIESSQGLKNLEDEDRQSIFLRILINLINENSPKHNFQIREYSAQRLNEIQEGIISFEKSLSLLYKNANMISLEELERKSFKATETINQTIKQYFKNSKNSNIRKLVGFIEEYHTQYKLGLLKDMITIFENIPSKKKEKETASKFLVEKANHLEAKDKNLCLNAWGVFNAFHNPDVEFHLVYSRRYGHPDLEKAFKEPVEKLQKYRDYKNRRLIDETDEDITFNLSIKDFYAAFGGLYKYQISKIFFRFLDLREDISSPQNNIFLKLVEKKRFDYTIHDINMPKIYLRINGWDVKNF